MKTLRIRNWEKWQSYRSDRGQPPWIKVHRALLRDPHFVSLTDVQRGHLVVIWLLAADRDGVIPASPALIKKLCYMDSEPDLQVLIDNEFIEPDDSVASSRRHVDANSTTQSRGEESRREESRGESAHAREAPGWDDLEPIARASIRGLYGSSEGGLEGTDAAVWREANGVDREACLLVAVQRWVGEGHQRFNQRLFRAILKAVIEEQRSATEEDVW